MLQHDLVEVGLSAEDGAGVVPEGEGGRWVGEGWREGLWEWIRVREWEWRWERRCHGVGQDFLVG